MASCLASGPSPASAFAEDTLLMCKPESTNRKVKERAPDSSSGKNEQEKQEDLSRYAQSLKREKKDRKDEGTTEDGSLKHARKCVNDKFGACQIVDNRRPQEKEQKPVGQPNETIEMRSGEKVSRLQLDGNGKPKQFNDQNGDTIVRKEDGKWYRQNVMNRDGELLHDFSVDENKNVNITYKVQKDENDAGAGYDYVRKQVRTDGTEQASYKTNIKKGEDPDFSKPDVVTLTTREGNTKTITALKPDGQPLQSLKYEGDNLVAFNAPGGTRFQRVEEGGKQVWKKSEASGEVSTFDGTVKSDSNGSVIVRDSSLAGKNSDQFARRYLANGTQVNSDDGTPPKIRTVTTAEGLLIQTTNGEGGKQTTFRYPTGQEVNIKYNGGKITQVSGSTANGAIDMSLKDGQWVSSDNRAIKDVRIEGDQIVIESGDGKSQYIDSRAKVNSLEAGETPPFKDSEHRTLVQELPENWEQLLKERTDEAAKHPFFSTKDPISWTSLKWLYDRTNTNDGDWDDKQKGGQYQQWGNFAWGCYASAMGLDYDNGIWLNGIVKKWNGASKDEWGKPWDMDGIDLEKGKAYGQNPADARHIKEGYAYYDQLARENKVASAPRIRTIPVPVPGLPVPLPVPIPWFPTIYV